MYVQLKPGGHITGSAFSIIRSEYVINEDYLRKFGFEKNDSLSGSNAWVYRYYNPVKGENGIELIYMKEFSILSVDEFWLNQACNGGYIAHTIVGKFKIGSDEDLEFIFSRNVRLNYIFNVSCKRI